MLIIFFCWQINRILTFRPRTQFFLTVSRLETEDWVRYDSNTPYLVWSGSYKREYSGEARYCLDQYKEPNKIPASLIMDCIYLDSVRWKGFNQAILFFYVQHVADPDSPQVRIIRSSRQYNAYYPFHCLFYHRFTRAG